MCDFCKGKRLRINRAENISVKKDILVIAGEICVGCCYSSFEVSAKINYCPMCGKKLNGK